MKLPETTFREGVRLILLCCGWVFPLLTAAHADGTKAAIRILRDECVNCHKPGKAKGGLLLHTREKLMAGGDSGEVVIPGKAAESLLLEVLSEDADPHMPPKKDLPSESIAAIRDWIDAGARWDATVFDEPPVPREVALKPLPASYHSVLALALSPDAGQLAVGRGSHLLLLDLKASPPVPAGNLQGHTEPIQSIAWMADGRRVITGGFQRVLVWDLASKSPSTSLTASLLGDITSLAVTRDGSTLFVADSATGGAGFIHQFDLASGKPVATWKGHDDTIYALKLSPDEQHLLSGGADKVVKLWGAKTREAVATFEGHTNHVLAVTFNKDGSRIASTGADREIKLWDVKTREQVILLGDKKSVYTALDWSPENDALVVTTDKGALSVYTEFKVHDGAQSSAGAKERKLTAVTETLTAVCALPGGGTIYAGGFDGNVHVWDTKTGKSTPVAWPPAP